MKEVKMTLNDKGVGLVVGIISTLILLLGIVLGGEIEKGKVNSSERWFTMEQAEKIHQLQLLEDKDNTGRVVYGRYDDDGNFIICWEKRGDFDGVTVGEADSEWD